MLKTILVPLDGSPLAERALPRAERLAQAGAGRIILVRAALAHVAPGTDPSDAQVRVIDEAQAYLSGVAARLAERGLRAETAVPYGEAAGAILDEIRIRRADAVVMATHGRSGLGRWLYGSVAEAVLGRSSVPVLLVRAWEQEQPLAATSDKPRLLVPLDGSVFAEAALPIARELAGELGAELVLVQAVFVPITALGEDGRSLAYVDQELDRLQADAQGYLLGVRDRLAQQEPAVESEVDVRVGAPSDAIATAGLERRAEMIVMATHGRTGPSRTFLGSVAGAVLRDASLPLLLIRPAALPPASSILVPPEVEEAPAGPPVTVALTEDDLVLIRGALETLAQTVTRKEHLHGRIHRLLQRLPAERAGALAE